MTTRDHDSETIDTRVIPDRSDEGKNVVGASGRDIGMVTTVAGGTMYVAPTTRLSEAVEQKLDWNDKRNASLPVPSESITRIDDEVALAVEREAR